MEECFKCDICDYEGTKKHNLREHIRRNHGDGKSKHSCDMCSFATFNRCQLKLHKQNKHEQDCQQRYVCDQCDFLGIRLKDLKTHKKTSHNVTLKSARSSFTLFLRDERKKLLESGAMMTNKEIQNEAKQRWKILEETVKSQYKEAARKEWNTWYSTFRPRTSNLLKINEDEYSDEDEGDLEEDACTEYEFQIDSTEILCGNDSQVQQVKTTRTHDVGNKIIITPEELDTIPILKMKEHTEPMPVDITDISVKQFLLQSSQQKYANEQILLESSKQFLPESSEQQTTTLVTLQLPVNVCSQDLHVLVDADHDGSVDCHLSELTSALNANVNGSSISFIPQDDSIQSSSLIISNELPFSVVPVSELSLSLEHNLNEDPFVNSNNTKKLKKGKIDHSCSQCDFIAIKKSDLKKHKKTSHTPSKLQCELCDFSTAHNSSLIRHMKRHAKKPKKEKSKENKKEKKELTSFFIFCKEKRSQVIEDLKKLESATNSRDINRELGKRWRNLDPLERAEFSQKSGIQSAKPVKPPKNAYNCFMTECVEKLKREGSKLSGKERFLQAGQMWRRLSEEEKKKYYKIYFEKRNSAAVHKKQKP